ncbi:tyrosine-type recombinase/integrase [bacterium]|nr:tyrosine-type recombinase/integrase [bacterium]
MNKHDKRLSLYTLRGQKYCLRDFINFLPIENLEDLDYGWVRQFFKELKRQKYSLGTIYSNYLVVMPFLNYYFKKGVLKYKPYFFIRKIKNPRTYTQPLGITGLTKLINATARCIYTRKKKLQYYRNKTVLGLLIYCGLRVGEIATLKRMQINIKGGFIKIIHAKFGIDRLIPIEQPLVSWIEDYLEARSQFRSHYFIIDVYGTKMNLHSITRIVRMTAKVAKIRTRVYSHLLRHSFASLMLKGGASLNSLKVLMGHKRIEMTAIYAKPDFEMIKKALLRNPLLKYYGGKHEALE